MIGDVDRDGEFVYPSESTCDASHLREGPKDGISVEIRDRTAIPVCTEVGVGKGEDQVPFPVFSEGGQQLDEMAVFLGGQPKENLLLSFEFVFVGLVEAFHCTQWSFGLAEYIRWNQDDILEGWILTSRSTTSLHSICAG